MLEFFPPDEASNFPKFQNCWNKKTPARKYCSFSNKKKRKKNRASWIVIGGRIIRHESIPFSPSVSFLLRVSFRFVASRHPWRQQWGWFVFNAFGTTRVGNDRADNKRNWTNARRRYLFLSRSCFLAFLPFPMVIPLPQVFVIFVVLIIENWVFARIIFYRV